MLFFFTDTPTAEIYTLSLHDALPIYEHAAVVAARELIPNVAVGGFEERRRRQQVVDREREVRNGDRKSTRLNSSHTVISYAVFCLKKKKFHSRSVFRFRISRA